MKSFFSLEGKVALVIGGTKGIGEGVAFGLARGGAKVVLASRHEERSISKAAELADETCGDVVGAFVDVTKIETIDKLVKKLEAEYGHIDILVNSAGINVRKDSVDFTIADWDAVQDVQLKGAFFACQAVAKHMLKNNIRGKIINISSIDYMCVSRSNIISYMAAKGAITQMTRALAVEWAEQGICVNAIAPGYFETDMTKVLFQDEVVRNELFSNIPQKKFGNPKEDLSGLAVYLASDASNYTTGQTICVDGGYTLI